MPLVFVWVTTHVTRSARDDLPFLPFPLILPLIMQDVCVLRS